MIIDTHAHIYAEEFDADRETLIEQADKAGVIKVLMPAIDYSTHEKMIATEKQFPGKCIGMMGLHPCSVLKNYDAELGIIEKYFDKNKFIAVGETGLDFYWDVSYKEQQYEALQRQIDLALHYRIPVVLHSRSSTDECIDMIRKNQRGDLKGVFHCFSGSVEQAKQIIDLGFYLGIGGVLTFKNSGLDKVVKEIGMSNLVMETDAPYLAPVPFRGKRNQPAYISYVAQKMADIVEVPVDEVAAATTANAEKLFGLSLGGD